MLKLFNLKILFTVALILLLNKNSYSDWIKVSEVSGSSCIVVFSDIILVGTDNGIYRSLDNGLSWTHYIVNPVYPGITDLAANNNFIFAGTSDGVYCSADTGKTWNYSGPSYSILSVFAKDSIIFACIHGGGLFRSENNGLSWTPIDGNHFYSYMLYDNKIFAGTFSGIYTSIDNGLSWQFAALPNKITTSISKNDNYFFATNYTDGIYRSDDYGVSWALSNQGIPLNLYHPYSIFTIDSLIFAGLSLNKVYLSTNNGLNWIDFSNGINISEDTYHVRFGLSGNKIFVSFLLNSLWYYDLSLLTNIPDLNNSISNKLIIHQNYPNPFNPVTTIKFDLPENSPVRLELFNSLGQQVGLLVNENKAAGNHQVEFNAKNLPGGIYYYRIKTAQFTQIRKMVLMK